MCASVITTNTCTGVIPRVTSSFTKEGANTCPKAHSVYNTERGETPCHGIAKQTTDMRQIYIPWYDSHEPPRHARSPPRCEWASPDNLHTARNHTEDKRDKVRSATVDSEQTQNTQTESDSNLLVSLNQAVEQCSQVLDQRLRNLHQMITAT